jgi:hypothetical protein
VKWLRTRNIDFDRDAWVSLQAVAVLAKNGIQLHTLPAVVSIVATCLQVRLLDTQIVRVAQSVFSGKISTSEYHFCCLCTLLLQVALMCNTCKSKVCR